MIRHQDSSKNSRLPFRMGLAAGVLCLGVSSVLLVQSVFRSTNSTAPISLLYIPVFVALYSAFAFLAGWCLGYVLAWPSPRTKRRIVWALAASLVTGVCWRTFDFLLDMNQLSQQVHQIQGISVGELEAVLDRPHLAGNKFVLGAIAQNPHATTAILHRITTLKRADLHEPMGSLFDVLGQNTKGLAVMRLVARHPNPSSGDMERLAASTTNEYVLGDVAGSDKLSKPTLQRLANHGGQLVEWGLARNPQVPPKVLSQLARSGDEYTRTNVAANPSTPTEVLVSLSQDQVWHVRRSVALNPSTSRSIIVRLASDADFRVRQSAVARAETFSIQ